MKGYYRFPTINKNQIFFVSEDNLWKVTTDNSYATRITANMSQISSPLISPDGKQIAYVGKEDGNTEVYVIPT